MSGFSCVSIMGYLTRDPELRYTNTGKAVCDITVAVTKVHRDKKETTFLECTFWARTAEAVAEHFNKGKPIIVQGELTQDNWTDKETGKPRSKIKITGARFAFAPRDTQENQQENDEIF